jgi:hypothetical protein
MSTLSNILLEMLRSPRREKRVLRHGLYLITRPADEDGRSRLVAARFGVWPSEIELRTVREALQDAFDGLGNQIAYDVATEWEKLPVTNEYAGYTLYWRTGSSRDTMAADIETARKLQAALEQRKQRLAKRSQEAKRQPARTGA